MGISFSIVTRRPTMSGWPAAARATASRWVRRSASWWPLSSSAPANRSPSSPSIGFRDHVFTAEGQSAQRNDPSVSPLRSLRLCGFLLLFWLGPGSSRAARAGPQADQRAAQLLLPGDVSPAAHHRAEQRDVVAGRSRAGLLHGRVALAPAARHRRGTPAHRWTRLRLPARLVTRRALRRVRGVYRDGRRSAPARSGEWCDHLDRGRQQRQPRAALVARWPPVGVRLDDIPGALPPVPGGCRRRPGGQAGSPDRGSRQQAPALLLQRVRPVPLAYLVARRKRADPGLQSRTRLGFGYPVADGRRVGCADARDPCRRDHVGCPPRLVARREARGLRVVPGAPVAPALADDRPGREPIPADLRRVRCNVPALVA